MARPSTPKLPVSKTLISEVLQRVSNAKTKAKKVEILQEYKSPALTKILLCNFAKSVSFVFPSGETPYTKLDRPVGVEHQVLLLSSVCSISSSQRPSTVLPTTVALVPRSPTFSSSRKSRCGFNFLKLSTLTKLKFSILSKTRSLLLVTRSPSRTLSKLSPN